MKELYRNPHTFDMSSYYSGSTVTIGGRDFDGEEKEAPKKVKKSDRKKTQEPDLSFLHLLTKNHSPKRI